MTDPTLFGFPFYYWFQFALILLAVALTVPAYFLASGPTAATGSATGCPPSPTAPAPTGRR